MYLRNPGSKMPDVVVTFVNSMVDLFEVLKQQNSINYWLDSHEFFCVIPNVCEGLIKISALYKISSCDRNNTPQWMMPVSYENSWITRCLSVSNNTINPRVLQYPKRYDPHFLWVG